MYKLIALDLDGTLLNSDKLIDQYNIDVLNKLMAMGVEIIIATGRRYWSAREYSKELADNMAIVANNGAIVRMSADDRLINQRSLSQETLRKILRLGQTLGLRPVVHVDGYHNGYDILVEDKLENKEVFLFSEMESRIKLVEDYDKEDEKILAVIYAGDKKDMEKLKMEIDKFLPEEQNSHIMENIYSAEALLEVMDKNVNKWSGIEAYIATKGIRPEEVIAVGDDNNDLEMLKSAGLGVAMLNATEGLKKEADLITEYINDQMGLGKMLEKIFKI